MNIGVFADAVVGGTFLSWTLYYLSGQNNYFYFKESDWRKIPDFPLTKVNAHGFSSNRIKSLSDINLLKKQIKMFDSDTSLNIFYMHPFNQYKNDNVADKNNQSIDYLFNVTQKKLIVSVPNEHHFYHTTYKKRASSPKLCDPTNKEYLHTDADQHEDFIDYFFDDAKKYWKTKNLNEVWDHREFLALNLRPYDNCNKITDCNIHYSKDVRYLDARDVWCTLDLSIKNIFEWLEISIDESRFAHWVECYRQWRSFHYQQISFGWYFEEIIKAITNNKYIDLKKFDLDIVQEAVIQHELIYKHNLNLKTHNLDKFIDTVQLHNLLEENFHPVEDLYNLRKKHD